MKFVENEKHGEVMGNRVKARPVPFALALKGMRAETDAARLEALAAVVRQCVTMEDGEAIEPDEISTEAVGKLAAFAMEAQGGVSDFTSAP